MINAIKNIIKQHLEDGQFLMDITHDVRGNFIRIVIDSEFVLTLDDTAKLTRSIKNASETQLDKSVRDQPKSCSNALNKTPKPKIEPMTINWVIKAPLKAA